MAPSRQVVLICSRQLKLRQQLHKVGLRRLDTQSPQGDFVSLLPQLQLPGLAGSDPRQLKLRQRPHEVGLRRLSV